MVKICEEMKGCRFWGYEPASGEFAHKPGAYEIRDQSKRDLKIIKSRDMKPIKYGMSKIEARNEAEHIENQTGVKMRIFNHDYL